MLSLCHYRFSCGVDFTIIIQLERLLKLYSYSYFICCCVQHLVLSNVVFDCV